MFINPSDDNLQSRFVELIPSPGRKNLKFSWKSRRSGSRKTSLSPVNPVDLDDLGPTNLNTSRRLNHHAAPVTSLREQDTKALLSLFDRPDSDQIEADIIKGLRWRCPEPFWEDESFDFLREYL